MRDITKILTTVSLITSILLAGSDSSSHKIDDANTFEIASSLDMEIVLNEVIEEIRTYRLKMRIGLGNLTESWAI